MTQQKKLVGPNGLVIELDRGRVNLENPGEDTPAMVYRNKGLRDESSATYWCAIGEGELWDCSGDASPELTEAECDWLNSKHDEVEAFLYGKDGAL